jgi:hypothetical protein
MTRLLGYGISLPALLPRILFITDVVILLTMFDIGRLTVFASDRFPAVLVCEVKALPILARAEVATVAALSDSIHLLHIFALNLSRLELPFYYGIN